MRVKALFLCTELSGYFMSCIETLHEQSGSDIMIYHQIFTDGSPYKFKTDKVQIRNKSEINFKQFRQEVIAFDPAIIYVGGWVNKDYKRLARFFVQHQKVVICGIDNPWTGSIAQRILCLLSPIMLKPYYTHMWVAGRSQFQFARELKYPQQRILNGVYAANTGMFSSTPKTVYQKELLFVGRFETIKGILKLYTTFQSLDDTEKNGWRLRLIGNGSLKDRIIPKDDILVESFMQPEVLAETTRNAGAFILPSEKEPWGVVVHEFAAAGLPLILSDTVNAGEEYLISNYNGFVFKSSDTNSLRTVLIKLFSMDKDQLEIMGQRSRELALHYTPVLWSATFLSPLMNIGKS